MHLNKEVTDFTRSGSTTVIPGPYLSPEQTESFPIKSKDYMGRSDVIRRCCFWSFGTKTESDGYQGIRGLRPIVACFFTFSFALTVALVLQIRFGEPQVPLHGSVASDSRECSQIGASVLKKGGNAVDAAVATTICLGVVLPHLTGIGGGGFLAVYDHRRRIVVDSIDFREKAPQKLSAGMGNIDSKGKIVGVPGFLRGLGLMHKLYGRLSWSDLLAPSINLCRTGFLVSSNLIMARNLLFSPATFNDLNQTNPPFWNHFEGLEAGHIMKDFVMAKTLQAVAKEGPEALYNGSLSQDFIKAIVNSGGQITLDDLAKYEPMRRPLIRIPFGSSSWLYTIGAPSGGPLLLAALRLYAQGYADKMFLPLQKVKEETSRTLESDKKASIVKNFSVRYTPTEPTVSEAYVTPNGDSNSLKNNITLIMNEQNYLSERRTAPTATPGSITNKLHMQDFNQWKNHSGLELGRAIIEPYKLKRNILFSHSDEGDNDTALEEDGREADSGLADLNLLLESIKEATILHSHLGDPDFSNDSNKVYQIVVNPSSLLDSLKKTPFDSKEYLKHRAAGSNVAVVDSDELYVSVVSGLNTWFGSQIFTDGGYLLNNALMNFEESKEDFPTDSDSYKKTDSPPHFFPYMQDILPKSLPHLLNKSEQIGRVESKLEENERSDNSPESGKRPLSESVVAFVIPRRGIEGSDGEIYRKQGPESGIEPCGQRIVLGSADAAYAVQVLIRMLLKGMPLVESIEASRIKPQSTPSIYGIEVGSEYGKWIEESSASNSFPFKGIHLPLPYPSVNGIQEIGDTLISHADSRGGGISARF